MLRRSLQLSVNKERFEQRAFANIFKMAFFKDGVSNKFLFLSILVASLSLAALIFTTGEIAFVVFLVSSIIALNIGAKKKEDPQNYTDQDFD